MTAQDTQQKTQPKASNVLLEWTSAERPFKERSQEYFKTIAAIVFLGGYSEGALGWLTIIFKVGFFFFLMLWVRASWPHIRPDQLMWLCWKVLMPLAVINVLITAIVLMV